MRLATYEHEGTTRTGIVGEGTVAPLPAGTSMHHLLADPAQREAAAAQAGEPVDLSEVKLRAPLTPTTMRDFVCFEAHVEGMVKNESPDARVPDDWYEAPTFYFTSTTAIFGPEDEIQMPPGCTLLDLELEIGVVIGKEGRDIPVERAAEHIAGFTIYNDFSARDLGAREKRMGLGWAKAKDFANALGPWIVTADEWERYRRGDRYDMELQASRNGEALGADRAPALLRLPGRAVGAQRPPRAAATGARRRGHPERRGHRHADQPDRRRRGPAASAEGPRTTGGGV